MSRLIKLALGSIVIAASTGCCCMYPGYGCGGGACGYSPYGASPYGGGVVAPTSAYYPTTATAMAPVVPSYAIAPAPVTAYAPPNVLPPY